MSEPPSVDETISWLQSRDGYASQIADHRVISGSAATYENVDVHRSVASALTFQGISDLYQHQVQAIRAVRGGQNVVIATPTASGKSLAYTVPALERAVKEGKKTLYIAPQRALISNQYETLSEFADNLGFDAHVTVNRKTGRTSKSHDRELKASQPDIVLTTIDQVHLSLSSFAHSPQHWRWLLQQLDLVVVDEVHHYRGHFGTHTGLILRRFNRLLDFYDSDPEYICCSATIGNPVDHAATVTGQPAESFRLVDTDTSATGDRHWVIWNPPLKKDAQENGREAPVREGESSQEQETDSIDSGEVIAGASAKNNALVGPHEPESGQLQPIDELLGAERVTAMTAHDDVEGGDRLSQHVEAVRLFCDLVSKGYQTLTFTRARQGAEQYSQWASDALRKRGQKDLAQSIHAYHGALSSDDRQEIEEQLSTGDARGVWSTNALELGIDIGTLDAVILDGYPGTIMETYQRAGRAGRGTDECLVLMVGGDDPLDQYMIANPDELFKGEPEEATLNPSNDTVRDNHLVCAAADQYLSPGDDEYFEGDLPAAVTRLEEEGSLERTDEDRIRWDAVEEKPRWNTDIRSIDDTSISVVDWQSDKQLGELNLNDALRDVHPEAIYVYRGDTYQVEELDIENREARLTQVDTNGYTRALREKKVRIQDTIDAGTIKLPNGGDANIGDNVTLRKTLADLSVESHYEEYLHYGYPSDDSPDQRAIPQDLPAHTIETRGLFIEIPSTVESLADTSADDEDEYLAALHAIEHTLISLFPRVVLCDRGDIGGLSITDHEQTTGGTIFVHDAHDGGAGYSQAAFNRLGELLTRTHDTIAGCDCNGGCPSCVHSPQCGNANQTLDKSLAEWVLEYCGAFQVN